MKFKTPLVASGLMLSILTLNAQVQIGADIVGEAFGDNSGYSVSMPDANTVAIGAPLNDVSGNYSSGQVRVYTWSGSAWVQKGSDLDGEGSGDYSGYSVSMPDANTVAIGAPYNDGNGIDAGHVRVYTWSGTAWVQKGSDIDGEGSGDNSGYSVSMPDANTVAIGAPFNKIWDVGHVRIYTWNGNTWVQKGVDIDGESGGDYSGQSISMPDVNTVAIGATPNNIARVYIWNSTAWIKKGTNIVGETFGDNFGQSVSMPNANVIAIGAPLNSGGGYNAGHVRVYQWGSAGNNWSGPWMQSGVDIDGEAEGDNLGWSVSMPDENTLAIGAIGNDGNGVEAGHVRIYTFSSSASIWIQRGIDIDGESYADLCGHSVSMPNHDAIAIGAPHNTRDTVSSSGSKGHTRIFSLATIDVTENRPTFPFKLYPNPVNGVLKVEVDSEYFNTKYSIFDNTGRIVLNGQINSEIVSIELGYLAAGVYTFKVGENMEQTFMVNK